MVGKVYRGEIYYIHETEVNGNEQAGGRPGIIVSNDVGNEHSPVVIVVYLTTQEKKPLPTHVKIGSAIKPSVALCEQIETVYKARVGNYIGQILDEEQKSLDKALAVSIGLGLTVKGNKAVEKWAEAYTNEMSSSMADALRKLDLGDLPDGEKACEDVEKKEPVKELAGLSEELIRVETEKNVYKELYLNLLNERFLTGER